MNSADAAFGIREIANANMVRAIRAVTIERGLDPRQLTLLAFGGSGPVHACDLARTLGMSRVLFPPGPGVFTAMGMLAGAVEHHELRSCQSALPELSAEAVAAHLAAMRAAAVAALGAQGYRHSSISFTSEIDLRLQGQDAALSIALVDPLDRQALREAFIAMYRENYGYAPSDTIEAVALRVRAQGGPAHRLDFLALRTSFQDVAPAETASREVYFDRAWVKTPIIVRARLSTTMQGPLIIESADTTIVIPPGASVAPDATGSLVATLASTTP